MKTEVFTFLKDLAANNDREWFAANKAKYDEVRADFEQTIEGIQATLSTKMPISAVKVKDCVFRIYRDVRFSKDKSPYKINFSGVVGPAGRKDEVHGLYLHIQPGECFVGTGLYAPEGDTIKKLRAELDYNPAEIKAILDAPALAAHYTLEGEKLKTLPKGYGADHEAIEMLKMKQFYIVAKLTDKQLTSSKLPDLMLELYQAALPFMDYVAKVQGLPTAA